jgi:hypothetical protein
VGPVVAGLGARGERRGRGCGAVGRAQAEQLRGGRLADRDAVLLGLAVGHGRELGAQEVVGARPGRRVQGGEDVVRGLVSGHVGPGVRRGGHGRLVRRRRVGDRDDRVVLGGLQDGEAAVG